MSTPEQIERDIEGTRRALSNDVDRLADKVSPGRVVGRRVDRVRSGAASVRDRVMGAAPDPQHLRGRAHEATGSAKGAVGGAMSNVGETASGLGDTVAAAPQAVKQRAQGSPLAAGLVAFGVGMVVSALVPPSEREKELAARAEDTAAGPLQEKAKEMAGQLQGAAAESAQQVKQTATEAAGDTVQQARSAAEDVKAPLQQ